MDRDRRDNIRQKFLQLGFDAEVAEACIDDELSGDTPILSGATLLYLCWEEINGWNDPGVLSSVPAARRLGLAGSNVDDLRQFARAVSFRTIFSLLYLLDAGPNDRLRESLKIWEPGYPGWSLMELDPGWAPTGRAIHCLYEGLRGSDPSGLDGSDFLNEE